MPRTDSPRLTRKMHGNLGERRDRKLRVRDGGISITDVRMDVRLDILYRFEPLFGLRRVLDYLKEFLLYDMQEPVNHR